MHGLQQPCNLLNEFFFYKALAIQSRFESRRVYVQAAFYAPQTRDVYPLDEDTEQGAVVSLAHRDKILDCVEKARQAGGKILAGGGAIEPDAERCRDGWFIEPTVIDDLAAESDCNQEEIFGPVVSLIPFEDEAQALSIANGTRYGLAASVWSGDIGRCHRMAEQLQAGLIWINTWMMRDLRTPMGGLKNSGVGREGGLEAMRFFTEPRNVCIKYR